MWAGILHRKKRIQCIWPDICGLETTHYWLLILIIWAVKLHWMDTFFLYAITDQDIASLIPLNHVTRR